MDITANSVIVTGCASGLGPGTARGLAEAGAILLPGQAHRILVGFFLG